MNTQTTVDFDPIYQRDALSGQREQKQAFLEALVTSQARLSQPSLNDLLKRTT